MTHSYLCYGGYINVASEIKTYKERPECAVPGCENDSLTHVAGQWICGPCANNWIANNQKAKEDAEKEMFKDIMEVNKNGD